MLSRAMFMKCHFQFVLSAHHKLPLTVVQGVVSVELQSCRVLSVEEKAVSLTTATSQLVSWIFSSLQNLVAACVA